MLAYPGEQRYGVGINCIRIAKKTFRITSDKSVSPKQESGEKEVENSVLKESRRIEIRVIAAPFPGSRFRGGVPTPWACAIINRLFASQVLWVARHGLHQHGDRNM